MVLTIHNDVNQFSPVVFVVFVIGLRSFLQAWIGFLSWIDWLAFLDFLPFLLSLLPLLSFLLLPSFFAFLPRLTWLPAFPSLFTWLYNRRFNRHIWGQIRRNLPI